MYHIEIILLDPKQFGIQKGTARTKLRYNNFVSLALLENHNNRRKSRVFFAQVLLFIFEYSHLLIAFVYVLECGRIIDNVS